MRRINSTYVTLDGVIQDPQDWAALGGISDEGTTIRTDLLLGCDAVLMGRHTYQGFAPVWAPRSGGPYTDRRRLDADRQQRRQWPAWFVPFDLERSVASLRPNREFPACHGHHFLSTRTRNGPGFIEFVGPDPHANPTAKSYGQRSGVLRYGRCHNLLQQ